MEKYGQEEAEHLGRLRGADALTEGGAWAAAVGGGSDAIEMTLPIIFKDSSEVWFSAFAFGWGYAAFALPYEVVCHQLGAADATPTQLSMAFELGHHRIKRVVTQVAARGAGERVTISHLDR